MDGDRPHLNKSPATAEARPGQRRQRRLVVMIAILERLLPLWTRPVDAWADPEAAFGEVYANPVMVNRTTPR
jgi:hypothetical protein